MMPTLAPLTLSSIEPAVPVPLPLFTKGLLGCMPLPKSARYSLLVALTFWAEDDPDPALITFFGSGPPLPMTRGSR